MEQAITRARRTGWSDDESKLLWETADEAQQQGLPLKAVFERIAEKTGRRVSFEYTLIAGVNDTPACADRLAQLCRGFLSHVNLIPVNAVEETGYTHGSEREIRAFQERLVRQGVNATVRRTLGADISAACGQLRRQEQHN